MTDKTSSPAIIQERIHVVRGLRVILDADLAALYGVPTKRFNEAVKRNQERFPPSFCFQLTQPETIGILRSQIATTLGKYRSTRYLPLAFTEHGALMAATVLNSPTAVAISIRLIEAFVALRQLAANHRVLTKRLDELESRVGQHDAAISDAITALRQLAFPDGPKHGRKIGFHP